MYQRTSAVIVATCLAVFGLGTTVAQADAGTLPPGDVSLYPVQSGGQGGQGGGIVTGPDGNLWFPGQSDSITVMSTSGTVLGNYATPGVPAGVINGPGGDIWFEIQDYGGDGSAIGNVTTSGTVTVFPLPAEDANSLQGLTEGPDGNLWYTIGAYASNSYIGSMTPAGVVTQYPLPVEFNDYDSDFPITAGPDGNLWFIGETNGDSQQTSIGRITTSGVITLFQLPEGDAVPGGITAGPDGNIWFVENRSVYGTSIAASITPQGAVTAYPLAGSLLNPEGITTGPDGNLYFTERLSPGDGDTGNIVGLTTSGAMTVYPTFDNDDPDGITAGPDGNIWFTDLGIDQIGELSITEPYATAINVTSTADPSTYGQAGDLTATLTPDDPSAPTPTGTATFLFNSVPLTTVPVVDGVATLPLASIPAGTQQITVTYSGDADYGRLSSDLYQQITNADATTTTLSSSANPSTTGQDVQVSATVSANAPGGGTPTGSVSFVVDGSAQSAALQNGVATLDLPSLTTGTHTITASYNPTGYGYDTNDFDPSTSATFTQTVNQAASATVTLSSSSNPSVYGQPVNVTITVTPDPSGGPTPTGAATVYVDGANYSLIKLSNGQNTIQLPALAPGTHTITATYQGDSNYSSASSAPLSQVVGQASTTVALTSSANPATAGQSVAFTATVAPNAPSAPGSGPPTGSVVFTLDGTAQPAVALTNGTATFSTSTLSTGTHTLTAAYSGDSDFTASTSSTLTQTVNASAQVTVTSSANPSVTGQTVTFTATVTPSVVGGPAPTGKVTFTVNGVAESPVTLHSGSASYKDTALTTAGTITVTAAYSGAGANPPGQSTTLNQVVNPAATAVTLTSSVNPSIFGQSTTLTATVAPVSPGTGTASGTVTLTIDGVAQTPITLSKGKAELKLATLAPGTHTITVAYSGSANYQSAESGNLTQTTNQSATAMTLTSSANPSADGKSVSFSVTVKPVSPGTGTVSGTVTFTIDGVAQAPITLAQGKAKLPISTLAPGTHMIAVQYTATTDYSASSATLTQTVNAAARPAESINGLIFWF